MTGTLQSLPPQTLLSLSNDLFDLFCLSISSLSNELISQLPSEAAASVPQRKTLLLPYLILFYISYCGEQVSTHGN
jgi:hypothetical protein